MRVGTHYSRGKERGGGTAPRKGFDFPYGPDGTGMYRAGRPVIGLSRRGDAGEKGHRGKLGGEGGFP